MKIGIAEVRNKLADAINRVAYGGERVVLERRGKGVVALVSMDDLALLEALENESDLRAAQAAKTEGGNPIPINEVLARYRMKPNRASGKRKAQG
jgi:prevent-host-death family protein